ncbi:MAG: S9 family peptidase [Saprospiraceae bacterium]
MALSGKKNFETPIARIEPKALTAHGDTRIDNYYWMKLSDEQKLAKKPDTITSEVVKYLNQENDYRKNMMSHLDNFTDKLFEEIKGRIKQDDTSVPYISNSYYYITRYESGGEYPIYTRKKENLDNVEEILLDVNQMAKGYDYYNISARTISTNNNILAYGEDTLSRRKYTLKFKNLTTGKLYSDEIKNSTGTAVWANDNKTIFYTRKDESLRSFKIFKHVLGTNVNNDVEVFHEKDDTFNAFVYKTKSKDYIVIGAWATLSQEYYILDANNPNEAIKVFQPRIKGLEYSLAHYDGKWYIRTNKDSALNFKIMVCNVDNTAQENWTDLIVHRKDVFIEGMEIFKQHLVINERIEGLSKIRIRKWNGNSYYVDFKEDAYAASISINPEFDTNLVRLDFTSMTTPATVYDYNTDCQCLCLLKQMEVIGDFEASKYESERIMVTARDGVSVPVSIVYKKGFKKDGNRPILLYAYGSYGHSSDPYFSSVRLSLLDRGFGFAIAHVRGGQELGRQWYEDGKFLNKINTFTDFIDVGQHLVNNNYTSSNKMTAMGGSAGGLLMGAIANMSPELWKGIVAAVPFVDVLTTMLDDTIPLTTGEYDEWGNPNDKKYYDYMKSYSPYDNVSDANYPALLVTTGYHDSQVQYWEPAKWVAKMRSLKSGNNPILMYCNMETGHGGASGRFRRYREVAMEYAFLLDLVGITK